MDGLAIFVCVLFVGYGWLSYWLGLRNRNGYCRDFPKDAVGSLYLCRRADGKWMLGGMRKENVIYFEMVGEEKAMSIASPDVLNKLHPSEMLVVDQSQPAA